MIRPFIYQALPMRVVFGAGSLTSLPDELAELVAQTIQRVA